MVDKRMNKFKPIMWSDNKISEIFSMTQDEFQLAFRKICGWKFLNDFDPNYFRRHGDEFPVVLIRKNNPYKKQFSVLFYEWLTNDN